jgi:two-component system response regulator VanR
MEYIPRAFNVSRRPLLRVDLGRPWDENADPFTNAVRITVSALRKRLGEPSIITTVAGVGYRIDAAPTIAGAEHE